MSEFIRIGGAWWRDDGQLQGDLVAGAIPVIEADAEAPGGLAAKFRVGAELDLEGHWMIVYDGSSPTPEPIFVENAEGVMDVLELWFVP